MSLTFSNVFTEKQNAVIPTALNIFIGSDEEKLEIAEIQVHEFHRYLQKIYPNKSTSPDKISLQILKECCAQLEIPITCLFNKFISCMEKSKNAPILKMRKKLLTIIGLV